MFNAKTKNENAISAGSGSGATLIGAGTILKGDIKSENDLRIDGTVIGNINSSAKVIIGTSGLVEGDISGVQADVVGKVVGNIRAKELLQLKGESEVTGNIYAGNLQIEPSATFNGQCHMGANIVEISKNEQQAVAK